MGSSNEKPGRAGDRGPTSKCRCCFQYQPYELEPDKSINRPELLPQARVDESVDNLLHCSRTKNYFFLYPAGHLALTAVTFLVSFLFLVLTQVIVVFFVVTGATWLSLTEIVGALKVKP